MTRPALRVPEPRQYSRILSIGGVRGERVVPNSEIIGPIDSSDEWIQQRTGIVTRRYAQADVSVADLVSRVERGLYVVGDKSWSIDMQRYNFQFTGQRFYAIENGQIRGQVADVAYQATTTDFWGSMEAVGGPSTYQLMGALNCGKGQPGQSAPVSHGAPAALFRGVNVLNTENEGGRA